MNINETVQSNDALISRSNVWSSLFEKYSKINDCEEDGLLIDEHVDMFAKEELNPEDEFDEPDVYISEDEAIVEKIAEGTDRRSSDFHRLSQKQRFEQLTYYFSPELLAALKKVFDRKAAEAERLNLPFWNFSREQ